MTVSLWAPWVGYLLRSNLRSQVTGRICSPSATEGLTVRETNHVGLVIGRRSVIMLWTFMLAAPAPQYFPPDLFLVRAKTLNLSRYDGIVKGDARITVATFEVIGVVAGPAELVGRTFQSEVAPPHMPTTHRVSFDKVVSIAEPGTEGLWWVTRDPKCEGIEKRVAGAIGYDRWRASRDPKGDDLRPELRASIVDTYAIRNYPYQNTREGDGRNFNLVPDLAATWKEGNLWAESVAAVYQATPAQRVTQLEQLAATPGSPVAGWAASLLVRGNVSAHTDLLKRLTGDSKLSANSQVTLDRLLSEIDTKGWSTSDARVRVLTRWLDPVADRGLFEAGFGRLLEASRTGEIDFHTYKAVLTPLFAKTNWPVEMREYWLGRSLSDLRVTAANQPQAFDWIAPLVKDAATPRLRERSAIGLGNLRPLSQSQVETVRSLRQYTTDADIQAALDIVLKLPLLDKAAPETRVDRNR